MCSAITVLSLFLTHIVHLPFRVPVISYLHLSRVFVSTLQTLLSLTRKSDPVQKPLIVVPDSPADILTLNSMLPIVGKIMYTPIATKIFISQSSELWLCYDKWTLRKWLRIMRWNIILNYLCGPKVITRLLIGWQQMDIRRRCASGSKRFECCGEGLKSAEMQATSRCWKRLYSMYSLLEPSQGTSPEIPWI